MKTPWYKTTKRWIQVNFSENLCKENNLDYWRKEWRAHPYQGAIFNAFSHIRFCQCGQEYVRPAEGLGEQDIFGDFVKAAKEDGLVVAARFDLQYANMAFAETHPDWFQRDRDGNIRVNQSLGLGETCICSDYYQKVVPALQQELIRKYSVDALTDNSWKANKKIKICYCENCKKQLWEETGHHLPQKVDWTDPDYKEWVKWSYRLRVRLWDHLAESAREAGGEDCIWAGMFHCDPMNRLDEFIDFHEISKRLRYLFLDHQCRDCYNGTDMEQNSMNGSLLHLMSSDDLIITEAISIYSRNPKIGGWFRLSAPPEAETQMWQREGTMGGLSPWIHYIGSTTYDRRRLEIGRPIADEHLFYEKYLYNRREMADVGVVWSQENGDFYGQGDLRTAMLPWEGFRWAMTRGHIPFLPINAHDIKRHADRVKTLVLPDLAVLGEEDMKDLLEYLDKGNNLVLTGKSGLLDEMGNQYETSSLWKKLGLRYQGEKGYHVDHYREEGENAQSYLHVTEPGHPLFRGFEDISVLMFGGMVQQVESEGILRPIADYVPAFPISPCEYSYVREIEEDVPTILAGVLPSGSRVVYFPTDLDRLYAYYGFYDYAVLLQNAVLWTLDGDRQLSINGTGYIDAKAFEREEEKLLHIHNITGSNPHAGLSEEYIPVGPLQIQWRIGETSPSVLYSVDDMEEIPFEYQNGRIMFTLDRLTDQKILVVK